MNIPILKELERLKIAHATAKVNNATFQPDEKVQKALIQQNTLRKEENKRRTEQKLKEADAKFKSKEKTTVVSDTHVDEKVDGEAMERPQTAPDFRNRSPSIKYSMQHDFARPKTAVFGDKRNPFDAVLKSSTANFRDDLQQHVHEQSKDSRRIFDSLLHHFKGGGVACHFSPKRDFEVIDINDILASRNPSHMRSNTVKLEDISHMKKKDGIALFFDPTTDTGSTVITVRIYFQKAIDLVTEESCSRDYQFHSDGNYFGLELSSESSCKGGGGDRSPNSPSQYSPADSPTPARRMSPTGSPVSSVRKMGSPGGGSPREMIQLVTFDQPSRAAADAHHHHHHPLHSTTKRSLPGWQGRPPIFIPSARCSLEILRVEGVSADAATSYNLSKLRIYAVAAANSRAAVKKVHEFCHEFFVSHTANLVVAGGISALNMAALHGNLEGVKQLVQSGANINARSKESKNHTALHEAVVGGHKEVAKYLLQMGANQLLRDEIGFSPLHHACKLENIALARVLIESESGKRALLLHNNSDQKPIELCTSHFMKIRIEGAMRKLKIFVKPRVSILDR